MDVPWVRNGTRDSKTLHKQSPGSASLELLDRGEAQEIPAERGRWAALPGAGESKNSLQQVTQDHCPSRHGGPAGDTGGSGSPALACCSLPSPKHQSANGPCSQLPRWPCWPPAHSAGTAKKSAVQMQPQKQQRPNTRRKEAARLSQGPRSEQRFTWVTRSPQQQTTATAHEDANGHSKRCVPSEPWQQRTTGVHKRRIPFS